MFMFDICWATNADRFVEILLIDLEKSLEYGVVGCVVLQAIEAETPGPLNPLNLMYDSPQKNL
jgi:hypothetical protein